MKPYYAFTVNLVILKLIILNTYSPTEQKWVVKVLQISVPNVPIFNQIIRNAQRIINY